jgi:Tfp pilus assembly protein PilV
MRNERGFSLVELLISLGITVVIVVAVAALFDRSNRMAKVETNVSDVQQSARYASYQVVRESRMAGAGGVPASDGGAQIGVTLSIGTSTYHHSGSGLHLTNNVNASTDSVFIAGTHHIKVGTDVLHFRGIISNAISDLGTSSFDSTSGTLVIHSCTKFPDSSTPTTSPCYPDGINDVSPYAAFSSSTPRLFEMSDVHGTVGIALLTAVTMGTDANGLANATLTLNLTGNNYATSLNKLGTFNTYLTTPARGGILDDLLYFIDDGTAAGKTCVMTGTSSNASTNPGPCHPQLAAAQWASSGSGCTVTSDDPFACATVTPIADDIEDMQIAYGMDFYDTNTNSGTLASPAPTRTVSGQQLPYASDNSLSRTNLSSTSMSSIVTSARGSSSPNADPSEDTSGFGFDEWVGNYANEIKYNTANSLDFSSDLTQLRAIAISILAKGADPDPQYKGLGAKGWTVMDSGATLVSNQNGYAYHRRLVPVRVSLRNYQIQ